MEDQTKRVGIRAKDLQVGDYLIGSRQTVLAVHGGAGGKVGLRLRTAKGQERVVRFGRSTTMTVERASS